MNKTSTQPMLGWLWSLPSAVAVVTVGILALGIVRLAQDEPMRSSVSGQQAAALIDECLPSVEVPTTSPVTILPLPAGNGQTIVPADGPNMRSATTMVVVATGPLQVQPRDKLPEVGGEVPLAGQALVLARSSGNFELKLESGAVLIRNGDARLLLREPARFGAAENTSYQVDVPAGSDIKATVRESSAKEKQAVVSPGTKIGTITIGAGQLAVPMQPLNAAMWIAGAPATLNPVRVSGQPGLADLAIETEKAGLRTDKAGATLVACGFREYADAQGKLVTTKWTRAGVSGVAASPAAKATLSLPSDLLPALGDFRTRLGVAMATSDGRSVAVGGGVVFGRVYAAGLATGLTGLLLGMVMFHRGQQVTASDNSPRWFAGLFIGPDNDPSLSLLQIFIWTTITVWGFFYVFFVAGNLLSLTPEMMQLLGIAGAGTVLARWIAMSSGGSTSQTTGSSPVAVPPPAQPGAVPAAPAAPLPHDFWKMLSTNGTFDLLKLQLFVFTVVIAMYVVWRIADAAAFPALDANTLLLLGVSQGVYVTSKLAGASALAKAQAIKANLDAAQDAAKKLADDKAKLVATKTKLAQQAPAGQPIPADVKSLLDDATIRLVKIDEQIAANATTMTSLEMDYDRSLAALGLKRV